MQGLYITIAIIALLIIKTFYSSLCSIKIPTRACGQAFLVGGDGSWPPGGNRNQRSPDLILLPLCFAVNLRWVSVSVRLF